MRHTTRSATRLFVSCILAISMVFSGVPTAALAEDAQVPSLNAEVTEQETVEVPEEANGETDSSEDASQSVSDEQSAPSASSDSGDSSNPNDSSNTSQSGDEISSDESHLQEDLEEEASTDEDTATKNSATNSSTAEKAEEEIATATDEKDAETIELAAESETVEAEASTPDVEALIHVQKKGWLTSWVTGGKVAGTTGKSLRAEALRLRLRNASGSISYRSHVQDEGWQDWVSDGDVSGSTGKSRRVEALQVKITGDIAEAYDVYYRVHAQNMGWMGWAKNGQSAGTAGMSLRIEALQVALVQKGGSAPSDEGRTTAACFVGSESASVSAHVQDIGWMGAVGNGRVAGTTGRSLRLEALRASLNGASVPGGIATTAHVQNKGWMNEVGNGKTAGSTGKGLRLEALKMRLTGEAADVYDLYYRVHVQGIGWLDWASEEEVAGSVGLSLRIEAAQVKLVREGAAAPTSSDTAIATPVLGTLSVDYAAFVQGSWQNTVSNGATAGTTGKSLALTGLRASVSGSALDYGGGLSYCAHVQDKGWQGWVSNGADAGSLGNKRVEALQMKLTGNVSKYYNVWYRVHVQDYGWLGWAKNGAKAGTVGMARRIEAVQIVVRGQGAPAPGSTSSPFVDGSLRLALSAASGSRSVTSFGGFSASGGAVNRLYDAINGIRGNGYDVGFIMMDLNTHKGVAYNCDALFYSASSIKAPYIASVVSAHPEAVNNFAYDITETLFYSWDYNYKNVLAAYGKEPMRTWCVESGVRTSIADQLPWADYTARELAKMWARTYTLYSESSAGETLGSWCERPNISTIHSTLGGMYRTRSKAGWIDDGGGVSANVNGGAPRYRVSIDGGIVYARNGAYVVAITSSVPANHDMLNSLTSAIDGAHCEM